MASKECCVLGCLNSSSTAPKGTTWHYFPKNKNLAKKWMEKIGENVDLKRRRRRNCVVCSEHFNKCDFKTRNTHKTSKYLSPSAVPFIFKLKDNKKTAEVEANSAVDISVLPLDVWENIFASLSINDVIALNSASKHVKQTVQPLFINHTLTRTCTSINLNHCYWIKPKEFLKIIRKTNLQHLHIIECKVNSKCIEAISDLNLTSLSISYDAEWRLFFKNQISNDSFRGFRDLKRLELFYKNFPCNIILEIYSKVLIHCKELEHFKVFQCLSQSMNDEYWYSSREENNNYDQTALVPTFVPKLKSLVIRLQNPYDDPNVANRVARLIALIMKDKVVPLQHADFGEQIGYLFKKNILPDPKIMLDKSTLSISCINTDINFWMKLSSVEKLISQPDYRTVEINNVEMFGFNEFAQKIVSNSGKTLKEIRIKHRNYFYNFYSEFLDGLSHIAINCPQITVFDITGHEFDYHQQLTYISNVMARKHKALLNALVNLKNLEKLAIPPSILECKYYKSNGEQRIKAMPFWKVTSACKNLIEIRISDCYRDMDDNLQHKKCCVLGCLNSFPKAPKRTTWHPFPKNENLAKQWIKIMGENQKRNSLVCSQHFNKKDFKTSSHNTRNKSRILSSSAVPHIFKVKNDQIKTNTILQRETRSSRWFFNDKQQLSTTTVGVNVDTEENTCTSIFVLPLLVWENIFAYLSLNDVATLTSTCKHLQRMVQTILKEFDFSHCYPINANDLLNHTLSKTCTSINLNYCYWLKPKEILTIIRKTNLQHLHIIECKVNNKCIKAICDLKLTSLSISYESEWKLFFRKPIANDSTKGLRELKSLELFYKESPSNILIEMYARVLIHCKELEHLKVFQCVSQLIAPSYLPEGENDYDQILPVSTLIPKLKSLVINLQNVREDANVARLIDLIMKDKVIPLQHVDLGHQTGYLLKKNILSNPKIIFDKSTLSISCINTDFNFWLKFSPVQKLICQSDYKIVKVRNVQPKGFYEFAQMIASNSGKTLKEIHIKHNEKFSFGYLEFLKGLSHIAINCPHITVFDITGHIFASENRFPYTYISNIMARKHKALLNALVNLKNLEKLAITVTILHCKYYKSNGEQREKAMPFWKVTSACKNLTEICIADRHHYMHDLKHHVHERSLYCIASCAKLKTLHLVRFHVHCTGGSKFDLSRITQSCAQLQELYIREIDTLSDRDYIFSRNIKITSTSGIIICDKAFLNDLSQCKNLEKLYFDTMSIEEENFKLLADVFRKLKNLKAFVVRNRVYHIGLILNNREDKDLEKSKKQLFESLLKSVVDERPAFYYNLKGFKINKMPSIYLDSLYPYGRDNYCIEQ